MTQSDPFQRQAAALKNVLDALAEVEESQRPHILRAVAEFLGVPMPGDKPPAGPTSPQAVGTITPQDHSTRTDDTPKQFIEQKNPQTDAERVACLAYYLVHRRAQAKFKSTDIDELNIEAAQPKFTSSAATAVANACRSSKFLVSAGSGQKQISGLGERVVHAMPDRDEVKAVVKKYGKGRRRKRPTKQRRAKTKQA